MLGLEVYSPFSVRFRCFWGARCRKCCKSDTIFTKRTARGGMEDWISKGNIYALFVSL